MRISALVMVASLVACGSEGPAGPRGAVGKQGPPGAPGDGTGGQGGATAASSSAGSGGAADAGPKCDAACCADSDCAIEPATIGFMVDATCLVALCASGTCTTIFKAPGAACEGDPMYCGGDSGLPCECRPGGACRAP